MEQFTANEVRTESCKQGQLHRQPASDMLNAFADMLEAREKAVPIYQLMATDDSWWDVSRELYEAEGSHAGRTRILYTHPAPSGEEKRETMTPRELAKRIERGEKWKLADEPTPCQSQNAERLADALHEIKERMEYQQLTPLVAAIIHKCDEALAAHSTQAQPPAASVTDTLAVFEVVSGVEGPCLTISRKADGKPRHEYRLAGPKPWGGGNTTHSFKVHTRELREQINAIEAALAAQENPNG